MSRFKPAPIKPSYIFNPYKMASKNKYITQLHCHSNASDGALTPANLTTMYKDAGYHALAITDHDMVTDQPITTMLPIVGNELTVSTSHIGSLFTNYIRDTVTDLQTLLWAVQKEGGLPILNHPHFSSPESWPIGSVGNYRGQLGVEIFNTIVESDQFSKNGYALDIWDYLLTNVSPYIWGFATDDFHAVTKYCKNNIGRIIVFSPTLTIEGLKQAILNGCFVADVGATLVDLQPLIVEDNRIIVNCPGATKIHFIGDNGANLATVNSSYAEYNYDSAKSYVRTEVQGKYSDDFTSDSGNWIYPYGAWTILDGKLNCNAMQDLPPASAMLTKPIYGDFDLYCEFTVNSVDGGKPEVSQTIGFGLHCSELTNASGGYGIDTGYLYHVYKAGSDDILYKRSGGTWSQAEVSNVVNFIAIGTTYSVKVKRVGSVLYCKRWIKDTTEPNWQITWDENTYNHGWIRLFCRNVTASFDNFEVDGIKSYYQPIVLS